MNFTGEWLVMPTDKRRAVFGRNCNRLVQSVVRALMTGQQKIQFLRKGTQKASGGCAILAGSSVNRRGEGEGHSGYGKDKATPA